MPLHAGVMAAREPMVSGFAVAGAGENRRIKTCEGLESGIYLYMLGSANWTLPG